MQKCGLFLSSLRKSLRWSSSAFLLTQTPSKAVPRFARTLEGVKKSSHFGEEKKHPVLEHWPASAKAERVEVASAPFVTKNLSLRSAMASLRDSSVEHSCAALLTELQLIWDELGEIDADRDSQLLAIEEECLQVYKRKVDEASRYRVEMQANVAESEKEVINICTELGEDYEPMEGKLGGMPLRQQLASVKPRVEKLRALKFVRVKEFGEVLGAITRLEDELSGTGTNEKAPAGIQQDLTLKRLEELKEKLKGLQEEKAKRLDMVLAQVKRVHSLCTVLGEDFSTIIQEVHPSLEGGVPQNKSVSSETLQRLDAKRAALLEEKKRRMQKCFEIGAHLVELWSLLDIPAADQKPFEAIALSIAASEESIQTEGALSLATLEQAENELARLEILKSSRMKELVGKKRRMLEDICTQAHMLAPSDTAAEKTDALIEADMVDPSELLAKIEQQIVDAKDESKARAPIIERVEKFLHALEQEEWLEEYNKDDNRYAATKGQHLLLKRAELARKEIGKLPQIVDALLKAAEAWEQDNGRPFCYDTQRVRDMVEEYNFRKQTAEEMRRREKEEKDRQRAQVTEQELMYGSSPNAKTPKGATRRASQANYASPTVNRRLSLAGPVYTPPIATSRANQAGHVSPVHSNRPANHSPRPPTAASVGSSRPPAKSSLRPSVASNRATPTRTRKATPSPANKPRPSAPANFVALAMAGPPGLPPKSPAPVPSAVPDVPPVLLERNFNGLALNSSGSPVKQPSRLDDRDIPPTSSPPSDEVVTKARFADRYDSDDSDSDSLTSDYDNENEESMSAVEMSTERMLAIDGKVFQKCEERAPFSQLNTALELSRTSEVFAKPSSPVSGHSPNKTDIADDRRLPAIPERRASSRY